MDTISNVIALPVTTVAASKPAPQQSERTTLPAKWPRTEIRHEPALTMCGCALKRIGEDVNYLPRVFIVERHVRGKWVCTQCETLIQAPVPRT